MECTLSPLFINAIKNVLVEDLHYCAFEVTHILEKFLKDNYQNLIIKNWTCLKEWLVHSGARDKWNNLFANERAKFIASWVKPYIKGTTVLDLGCGSGEIGKIIDKNFNVFFAERNEHYNIDRNDYANKFWNIDSIPNSSKFDTVLVITTLHHEVEPVATANFAKKLAKQRIIIVENCVCPLYDAQYQEAIDIFFNHCLNETNLPNPCSHKTVNGWIELFSSLQAKNSGWEYRSKIPGIPMPHDLIVFDV